MKFNNETPCLVNATVMLTMKTWIHVSVFLAILIGAIGEGVGTTMDQIDHKDKPGEYRNSVFEAVQETLKFKGEKPPGLEVFLGNWVCRFGNPYSIEGAPVTSYQSFLQDGSATEKAVDGSWQNLKDRWKFNDDGSFSLWSYVEPMPEYGIDKPTYSEERYHVLMKHSDEFALFNGDGSLIKVYTKVKE